MNKKLLTNAPVSPNELEMSPTHQHDDEADTSVKNPNILDQSFWNQIDHWQCGLLLIIIAILGSILAMLFGNESVTNECESHNNILIATSLNSSIVSDTVLEYCDCVPEWMGEEGVYFDPLATLILAILAVLAFIILERFRPVMRVTMKWFWHRYIGNISMTTQLNTFLSLSKDTQWKVETGLRLKYQNMPQILLSESDRMKLLLEQKKEKLQRGLLESNLKNSNQVAGIDDHAKNHKPWQGTSLDSNLKNNNQDVDLDNVGQFHEGMKVEARFRGKARYYSGVIKRVNPDGTYAITYDDGEKEMFVAAEFIKSSGGTVAAQVSSGGQFHEGMKVEARFRGKARYYSGVIKRVNPDGTYAITYDDGEKEMFVAAEFIKSSGGTVAAQVSSGGQFHEGMKVEARFRGKARYYSGVIKRVNPDGTYAITYDDGEKEMFVAAEFIKSSGRMAAQVSSGGQFHEGMKVEARFRGKARYYSGVIKRVNPDGTYAITYDDGEKEMFVAAEFIKSSGGTVAAQVSSGGQFHEGMKVEARFRGKARYYSGVIKRVNPDGTYAITYDDGEKEMFVGAEFIKSSGAAQPSEGDGNSTEAINDFENHDKIRNNISLEFIKWFEAMEESAQESQVEEFLKLIFSTLEAQVEEVERLDSTIMLFVQLLLGFWVLIDYFLIQEWPTGDWQCKWAYFSGVVMFKSFTIPLWSCLTTACHYTFAHQLYKNRHRDITTGTPYGAPIVRNKFTLVMISAVAFLLGIWLFVTMTIALPLMLVFSPIVMLPAFIVPVTLFIGVQKSLKWIKQMLHVDDIPPLKKESKPVPFLETVFVLKAAATQLISVAILCFLLLPFYKFGFKWWNEGASLFLLTNFDFPTLRLRFTYTLTWPEFEQPRLQIQLAMGVFLIALQAILKITKRLLLMHQEYVLFDDIVPGFYEELAVSVLSQCSWRPFRTPMDAAQTALEFIMSRTHTRFVMWFYGYDKPWMIKPYAERDNKRKACLIEGALMSIVSLPLFISAFFYYLFVSKRAKHFGVGTTDEDILKFTDNEECMVFTDVQIDEGCKATDFSVIKLRCPWIDVYRYGIRTAYKLALEKGFHDIAKILKEASTDMNKANEAMILAARSGNVDVVNFLLEAKIDKNYTNQDGETILCWAVQNDEDKCLELLLTAGADNEKADKNGNTPLLVAVASRTDRTKCLELLLAAGVDNNKPNLASGKTALCYAAFAGNDKCLELLLAAGADKDKPDNNGITPLSIAATQNKDKCLELLLAAGADKDKPDKDGNTPLINTAKYQKYKCMELLLAAGAETEKVDKSGYSSLWLAIKYNSEKCFDILLASGADINKDNEQRGYTPLTHVVSEDMSNYFDKLLAAGADVNKLNLNNRTPLLIAAQMGSEKMLKQLIVAGADVNKANKAGTTPLSSAAEWGKAKCIELLIAAGANCNVVDNKEFSPLFYASTRGNSECLELLLAAGADKNRRNKDGSTPLFHTVANHHDKCLEVLLAAGAEKDEVDKASLKYEGFTPLLKAAKDGTNKAVKLLLEAGANQDVAANDGQTPLFFAAWSGKHESLKLMLAKGFDKKIVDQAGGTPLLRAAQAGHDVCLELLIEAGFNIDQADKDDKTPLSWATRNGQDSTVKVLLAAGANKEKADNEGNTPLFLAILNRREKSLKLLLAAGVDPNKLDKDGLTALDLAEKRRDDRCIDLLEAAGGRSSKR